MITARARTRGPLVNLHGVRLPVAREPRRAFRDHDLRAKLLGLRVGAARQLLPGNAGRKPEIVLDPRARPSLAARRVRFEHQDVEAFRRAVDGGRQTRRPGADDHQVAHVRLIDGVVEAQAVGDLLVARIAQHGVAAADQHRHIGRAHMKPIEQLLRVGVAIEVDVVVRMAVAGQELLDPQRAGAMRRPDHDDIAEPARNQLDAAEDERPHEDLAQLGVGLHEGEQLLAIELDHLAGLADAQPAHRPAAGDHVAFAGELARRRG